MLGCYFIRDAEKTECRAKMKGQTLQCLVNVCQFFSHVICGYDPLANTSTCRALDIHSCLRPTKLSLSIYFFLQGAEVDQTLTPQTGSTTPRRWRHEQVEDKDN